MIGTRVSAIAGIIFTVSFVAGFLMLGEAFGNFGDSDSTFAQYYKEDREFEILGGYLLVVSSVAFVIFVAGVCAPALTEKTQAPSAVAGIVSAAVFATLVSAAAAAIVTIPASRFFGGLFDDEGQRQLVSEIAALPQLGYVLLFLPGALFASATLVCLSLVMRRMPGLAGWVAMSGFVAAALLLASFFFMPLVALPLWVLAASVALLRAPGRSADAVRGRTV